MYDLLKALAAAESWRFLYARRDFQNLFEEAEQVNLCHLFLDPVKIEEKFNDSGEAEAAVHSGSFMLLYSSDIDKESYEKRFEDYMKPIVQGAFETVKTALKCESNVKVESLGYIEVINLFDYNFDGLLVNFVVRFEL